MCILSPCMTNGNKCWFESLCSLLYIFTLYFKSATLFKEESILRLQDKPSYGIIPPLNTDSSEKAHSTRFAIPYTSLVGLKTSSNTADVLRTQLDPNSSSKDSQRVNSEREPETNGENKPVDIITIYGAPRNRGDQSRILADRETSYRDSNINDGDKKTIGLADSPTSIRDLETEIRGLSLDPTELLLLQTILVEKSGTFHFYPVKLCTYFPTNAQLHHKVRSK